MKKTTNSIADEDTQTPNYHVELQQIILNIPILGSLIINSLLKDNSSSEAKSTFFSELACYPDGSPEYVYCKKAIINRRAFFVFAFALQKVISAEASTRDNVFLDMCLIVFPEKTKDEMETKLISKAKKLKIPEFPKDNDKKLILVEETQNRIFSLFFIHLMNTKELIIEYSQVFAQYSDKLLPSCSEKLHTACQNYLDVNMRNDYNPTKAADEGHAIWRALDASVAWLKTRPKLEQQGIAFKYTEYNITYAKAFIQQFMHTQYSLYTTKSESSCEKPGNSPPIFKKM